MSIKKEFLSLDHLKSGDVVDLISPGYRCTDDEVEKAVQFLESWNLSVRVPKDFFGADLLSSHDDFQRFSHLNAALHATDSKAVWCLRGGYGSIHMLPALRKLKAARPKLFIGLSDITSLHQFLEKFWNWPVLHGPLLDRLGGKPTDPQEIHTLRAYLFGEIETIDISELQPINSAAENLSEVNATLTGGNLTVFQSLIGTLFAPKTKDKLLFFEDIGERGYRVDRMLHHFEQAGLLSQISGLMFGEFTGGDEPQNLSDEVKRNLIWPVIRRFCENKKFPAFNNVPCGHGFKQRPLFFGAPVSLIKSNDGFLLQIPFPSAKNIRKFEQMERS